MAAMAPATMGAEPEMLRGLVSAVMEGSPLWCRATLVVGALSDPGGAKRSLSAHCEVAAMLAERLGTGPRLQEALAHGYERWDGAGFPDGLAAESVPSGSWVCGPAKHDDAETYACEDRFEGLKAEPGELDAFERDESGCGGQ